MIDGLFFFVNLFIRLFNYLFKTQYQPYTSSFEARNPVKQDEIKPEIINAPIDELPKPTPSQKSSASISHSFEASTPVKQDERKPETFSGPREELAQPTLSKKSSSSINLSLIGHILLDSESSGRFGVQGQVFKNVLRYFSEYLQKHFQASSPEQTKIVDMVNQLIQNYNLDVEKLYQQVMNLQPEKTLVFPGGWNGQPGHAMLYVFENIHDKYHFSIINSGAGLRYHEKTSSLGGELFCPIKTYALPLPIDKTELKQLITRLVVPQLAMNPPVRKIIEWNEKILYENIETSLLFLKASPVLQNLEQNYLTTAGQLSGTCVQRCIHQFIKIIFKDLAQYQEFIFHFKMYALEDYLNTYPGPYSAQINQFLIKAIQHNLLILEHLHFFKDDGQKQDILSKLLSWQKNLQQSPPPIKKVPYPHHHLEKSKWVCALTSPLLSLHNIQAQENDTSKRPLDFLSIEPDHLLEDMQQMIERCSQEINKHPIWVMAQIEKIILQLPIPEKCLDSKDYPNIEFYQKIATPEDFYQIENALDRIQELYINACQLIIGPGVIPSQFVTEWSLFVIRDYFDKKSETPTAKPYYSALSFVLPEILKIKDSPFLASNYPEADVRLRNILHLLIDREEKEKKRARSWDRQTYVKPDLFVASLKKFPDLNQKLQNEYEKKYHHDQSHFHRSICSQNMGALYVFLQQYSLESTSTEPEVMAVIHQFKRQLALEQFFINGRYLLLGDKTENKKIAIERGNYSREAVFKRPDLFMPMGLVKKTMSITQHKYNLKPSAALHALLQNHISLDLDRELREDYPDFFRSYQAPNFGIYNTFLRLKLNENEIQLVAHHSKEAHESIEKQDYLDRYLFSLRWSAELQISLTLSFFSTPDHIQNLSDPNIQRYLEANLFQPGLILDELKKNSSFLKNFDEFMKEGAALFKGLNPQASVFFIRLQSLMHCYCAMVPGMDVNLIKDEQILSQQIESCDDEELLVQLHACQFFNAMTQYRLQPHQANQSFLSNALYSYIYIQTQSAQGDTDFLVQKQRAALSLKFCLSSMDKSQLKTLIDELIPRLFPELIGKKLTFLKEDFLIYEFIDEKSQDTYTIHLEQGRFFQNGVAIAPIPLIFKNHALLKQLGLSHLSHCLFHNDGKTISFQAPWFIRMSKENHTWMIQKKMPSQEWYQLTPLTQEQNIHFQLNASDLVNYHLPAILSDGVTQAWMGPNDAYIVNNGKPLYKVDQQGLFHALDEDGSGNGLFLTKNCFPELSHFESDELFLVNLDEKQSNGMLLFPRYDLVLTVKDSKIYLSNTDYVLMTKPSIFPMNVASLEFSNDSDSLCIVAVQAFYYDPSIQQTEGHYYQLTHDISRTIPEKIFPMFAKLYKQSVPIIWNFTHSERTITYPIVNGQAYPKTASDALYLCYIYLACHQTEKAKHVLENMRQYYYLTGSVDELTFLSWIVNAIPMLFNDKDQFGIHLSSVDEHPKQEAPEFIVCQLKALALYTDFLECHEIPQLIKSPSQEYAYKNDFYQSINQDKLTRFVDTLPKTVQLLCHRYQNLKRHLHEEFYLNDNEWESLLNFIFPSSTVPSQTRISRGSLGYELKRLQFKKLFKEYCRLEMSWKESQDPDFKCRLEKIDQLIAAEQSIEKIKTIWEREQVNLNLLGSIQTSLLNTQSQQQINKWSQSRLLLNPSLNEALNMLHSGIEQETFIENFPTYLYIIQQGKPEQKDQIENFCRFYLTSPMNSSENIEKSNIPFLSNILYRLIKHPELLLEKSSTIEKLIVEAQKIDMPGLYVLQAKDVYDGILIDARDIWEEIKNNSAIFLPMPKLKPIHAKSLTSIFNIDKQCLSYRQKTIEYQRAVESLSHIGDLYCLELQVGQLKSTCMQNQKQIAQQQLQSQETRLALQKKAIFLQSSLQQQLKLHWNNLLNLANQAHHQINQKQLLKLYLHAEASFYEKMTGLSGEDCHRLHRQIHQTVSLELKLQQVNRLLLVLEETMHSSARCHEIASILITENVSKAQTDPGLMLFQYAENILINQRQAEVLESLLSTPNLVEKVIMGGGKSKVILPLLAQKKASGLNLVVIEVPRSLLATNHIDLNETSQRLFGQKGHRFEFNRESDSSPQALKQIYQRFNDVMNHQDYLVTTGDSIQSLELKYIELLQGRPQDEKKFTKWQEQIYWAGQIVTFIKQRGDAIIDEAHQGLLLQKKLNYTLGFQTPIPVEYIQHEISLYQFADLLSHPPGLDELLTHPHSPLKRYLDELNPENNPVIPEQIKAWFSNQKIPTLLNHSSSLIKNAFAFFKEQLILFPQTNSRHYKEHYGPSEVQTHPFLRALAIPYAASNRPNERSRFGETLETLNYTVQGLLLDGLNEDLIQKALENWKADMHKEFLDSEYLLLSQTPTAKRINHVLQDTGILLHEIKTPAPIQIFEKLKNHRCFIFLILQEHILPQIMLEPELLHSDAYVHVDLYRSVHAISGTPWNHSTYHQNLKFNFKSSLGSDGYIQSVLKEKQTPLQIIPFTQSQDFLEHALQDKNDVRAIIDACAMFAGISNEAIAKQLAKLAQTQNQPEALRYILFFNEKDILYALNIDNPKHLICLATSDSKRISEILKCSPAACLTYYDQSHSIGTDIQQTTTAHGLVLVDKKTYLQSFLQACMRMRGLAEHQHVTVIVSDNELACYDDCIIQMTRNEKEQLKQDNFFAAIAKMNNVIRQNLLGRLYALPEKDGEAKYQFVQRARHYFIQSKAVSLFEQFGGLYQLKDTKTLLESYATVLLHDWEKLFDVCLNEKQKIESCLLSIIEKSLPGCNEQSIFRSHELALETEQQQEQEQLAEQMYQNEVFKDLESFNLESNPRARLTNESLLNIFNSFITTAQASEIWKLNDACGPTCECFSSNLLILESHALVFEGQKEMLGPYLKPSLAILFRKQDDDIHALLIDLEDVVILKNHLFSDEQTQVWISTTQHDCLAGSMPQDIAKNISYQVLIEQILFFNGECLTLAEQIQKQPNRPYWLYQDFEKKLLWLAENIEPYRTTTVGDIQKLKKILNEYAPLDDFSEQKYTFFAQHQTSQAQARLAFMG